MSALDATFKHFTAALQQALRERDFSPELENRARQKVAPKFGSTAVSTSALGRSTAEAVIFRGQDEVRNT